MSEVTPTNLDDWVVRLSRNLTALIDPKQRSFFFASEIVSEPPEAAVRHFRAVLHRGFTQRGRAQKIALETAMVAVAGGTWPAAHRRKTFDAALAEGDKLVSLMIGSDFLYDVTAEEVTIPVPPYCGARGARGNRSARGDRSDRTLTLGERKSVAMRRDRRTIALALRDPSPKVIEKLLANPRVTETDVVSIAANRPVSREVLTVVGLHPKWRLSPRVAFALVMNPMTHPTIALSLIHNLHRTDAKAAFASPLSRPVEEALTLLLAL